MIHSSPSFLKTMKDIMTIEATFSGMNVVMERLRWINQIIQVCFELASISASPFFK